MADSVVELGGASSSSDVAEVAPTDAQSNDSATQSVMTASLDDAQYAQLCGYIATQMYISIAILAAVGLVLGSLLVQQVLSRWGVR